MKEGQIVIKWTWLDTFEGQIVLRVFVTERGEVLRGQASKRVVR